VTCVVSCAIKPLVVQLVTSIARGSGEKKSVVSVVVAEWGAGVRAVGGRALVPRLLHPARITRQLSLPPFSESLRSE
jgi:hypothetical protein